VKQRGKIGRPEFHGFETAMRRSKLGKGFYVVFDYSGDALREMDRLFGEEHAMIMPLTVREILGQQIAKKLG